MTSSKAFPPVRVREPARQRDSETAGKNFAILRQRDIVEQDGLTKNFVKQRGGLRSRIILRANIVDRSLSQPLNVIAFNSAAKIGIVCQGLGRSEEHTSELQS